MWDIFGPKELAFTDREQFGPKELALMSQVEARLRGGMAATQTAEPQDHTGERACTLRFSCWAFDFCVEASHGASSRAPSCVVALQALHRRFDWRHSKTALRQLAGQGLHCGEGFSALV